MEVGDNKVCFLQGWLGPSFQWSSSQWTLDSVPNYGCHNHHVSNSSLNVSINFYVVLSILFWTYLSILLPTYSSTYLSAWGQVAAPDRSAGRVWSFLEEARLQTVSNSTDRVIYRRAGAESIWAGQSSKSSFFLGGVYIISCVSRDCRVQFISCTLKKIKNLLFWSLSESQGQAGQRP